TPAIRASTADHRTPGLTPEHSRTYGQEHPSGTVEPSSQPRIEGSCQMSKPGGNASPPAEPKRGFQLPSAYTILIIITVVVAILTWFIPAGLYQSDDSGRPKPGSYTRVESTPQGIKAIFGAPINGMYGIRSNPGKVNAHGEMITLVDQGTVSVYNQGR